MKFIFKLLCLAAAVGGYFLWREYSGKGSSPNPAEARELSPDAAELTKQLGNCLIFVEGKTGVGSGFVCAFGGKKFVLTNQHVIAGNPGATFTLLDQSPITTGQAAAAVGHDIMSFALLSDAKAMEIMVAVERNAAIGDDVVVLGNADGSRVIKPLMGKLVGIGPDRIEVSAEFVHGNSGSPIIHVKSGKVIGIATYATYRKLDSITGKPKEKPQVKRFGYRLDTVKQWQPIAWPAYAAEFQTVENVEKRSDEFLKLLTSDSLNSMQYGDQAIRSSLERYKEAATGRSIIKTTKLAAAKDLIGSLRNACDSDVNFAAAQVRYDYFRRKLDEQLQFRRELHKGFDEFLKRIPR